MVAIIGRSGSGKSTLLRCINGLETYQSGATLADGIDVGGQSTNLRELRGHVGMVFGGQQQRVAIARSLAMRPKVLLCDEITSALDPEPVNEVLRAVEQLAREGMTLIPVTHEMRFARHVGTKLVFMHHGVAKKRTGLPRRKSASQ